jgi:hypothetical protein
MREAWAPPFMESAHGGLDPHYLCVRVLLEEGALWRRAHA